MRLRVSIFDAEGRSVDTFEGPAHLAIAFAVRGMYLIGCDPATADPGDGYRDAQDGSVDFRVTEDDAKVDEVDEMFGRLKLTMDELDHYQRGTRS